MKPTKKSSEIENFLNNITNRTEAIEENFCVNPPIGCGKKIVINEFRDEISLKEYRISGMCQKCQDNFFGV